MNILVTGSTGFLGGRIAKHLSEHHVTKYCGNILELDKYILWQDIDAVIHLVGLNDTECRRNAAHGYNVNVTGTHNLLSAVKCDKIIYFSTIQVYGYPPAGRLTEESSVNPQSTYAMSHYIAEEMILRHKGGVVLRPSSGFGCPVSYNRPTAWVVIVNSMCKQAIEQGKIIISVHEDEMRNFITATDICRAVSHVLMNPLKGIFNIGSKYAEKISDMAYRVADRCNVLFGDRPEVILNNEFAVAHPFIDYRSDKIKSTGFEFIENYDEEIDNTLVMIKEVRNAERDTCGPLLSKT